MHDQADRFVNQGKAVLFSALFLSSLSFLKWKDVTIPGAETEATRVEARAVRPITAQGVRRMIDASKGRILVVNLWATWCVPCIEEFPDLVRLHGELSDSGVSVVGISIDDEEDLSTKVIPFLDRLNVPFNVWIKQSGGDEQFITAMNPDWSGAVPATFIYDRRGRQRRMLIGRQTLASLRAAIASDR